MSTMPEVRMIPLSEAPGEVIDAVLGLNEHWVPHVGSLTSERLDRIVSESTFAVAAAATGEVGPIDGFVIVLGPGADYDSPNYRYFEERLAAGKAPGPFRYVDRIAVAPEAQGTGIGRMLYEATFDHARRDGASEVTCEVNLDPPNPDSQAFHARLGFVEVGRQWTYGETVEVQMLARVV